jgi:nucleotide-binding universal stress UspA family protein
MEVMDMYEQVVVPLDGSRFSEFALSAALGIVEKSRGHLTLLTAVSNVGTLVRADLEREGEPVQGWFEEERARATKHLEDTRARILETIPGLRIDTKLIGNRPVPGIAEYCERVKPDLLVLSTHGRGALSRAWLGSVADGLVRRVDLPILLVRPEKDDRPDLSSPIRPQHILVPLDGSRESETILPTAEGVARLFGARLTLLSVVRPPSPFGYGYLPDVVQERHEQKARVETTGSYLAGVSERLAGKGLSAGTEVLTDSDAAGGILAFAASKGVDLIVMPTHARGGASRALLGSVADKVIRGTDVPVLVRSLPDAS